MRGYPFWFSFLGLLAAISTQAQERLIVEAELAGRLDESYDRAKVSGPPLVGLRLGSAEGNLEPDSLIVVRPDLQDFTICVRTTTQDGRYSSSAPYRITSDRPEAGYVRLSPVTIEYESILSSYPRDSVGVRAYATRSRNCLPDEAVHLPFLAGESLVGAAQLALVVFANGRSQVGSAALYDADDAGRESKPVRNDCERAGSSSLIAYDLRCRLDLPSDFGGRAVLQLSFNDGFETTHYRFDLYLPERRRR